jgi:protein gp37
VPVLSGGSFLIAALSPISWTGNNFNPVIGVLAISFGVVSAYCVVMFVEACKELYQ